jgi:cysteine desulfurase
MFRLRRIVNCDHNATTPISRPVRLAMTKSLKNTQANPSTPYREGRLAAQAVAGARSDLAKALNVDPARLIFTSGATEANNHVRAIATLLPEGRRFIIHNPMEHPAMLEPLKLLEGAGFSLLALKPDSLGRIRTDELDRIWRPEVSLVVMMAANNETGTLYDLKTLIALAHSREALFFSDMVQALGKIPVDLLELGVDYASFSAHKIYGPKGVGALYVKEGAPFAPLIVGGNQENGQRAGTEAPHNLVGLGAAAREIPQLVAKSIGLRRLKEIFIKEFLKLFPQATLNTPQGLESQPGTISLTLPGYDNAFLLGQLDYHGVSVAAGSACRTGANEPSHVLLALGLSQDEARSTLRLSFGVDFSKKDLSYLIKVFKIILSDQDNSSLIILRPKDITEELIFQRDLTIIHIKRYPNIKGPKPLPGSQVIFLSDHQAWASLKPKGPILLTCEVGYDAPIMAWSLKRRGLKDISVLALGLWGLRLSRPDLYDNFIFSE